MSKCIVVVGATGDVGQGIVGQLLSAGHRVIAVGRNGDKLQSLRQRLGGAGNLDSVVGSVETEDSASSLVAQVTQVAPKLDGVIVSVNAPLKEVALPDVDSARLLTVLSTNLATHLIAAKAFVPLLAPGASYIAIGGGMADFVAPGMGLLSMCQAAQRVMFKVLAAEWKDKAIHLHELMLYSMIAGASNRTTAHPKWITDEDVGRHVNAILDNPDWFAEPIITLKSRREVGLQSPAV